jgi:hypothetical protein
MNTTERELLEQARLALLAGDTVFYPESKIVLSKIEAYLAKPVQKTKVWNADGYEALCQQLTVEAKPVQEPVGTVRSCVWNGQGFTISAITSTKLRFDQPLYTSQQSREPISEDEILEAIARGWCHAKNVRKEMDGDLASAIASEVSRAIKARH